MIGHSKQTYLSDILWADSEIESINIDYDRLDLLLKESTGLMKKISAGGFIGYQCIGFWDEIIVQSAAVFSDHPFLEVCTSSLSKREISGCDSGCEERNLRTWKVLQITLVDGCQILVTASTWTSSLVQ